MRWLPVESSEFSVEEKSAGGPQEIQDPGAKPAPGAPHREESNRRGRADPPFAKLFDDRWNTCRLVEKPLTVRSNFTLRAGGDVWKEGGENAERGKKRADVVDEVDAGVVGKLAQQCGADTA